MIKYLEAKLVYIVYINGNMANEAVRQYELLSLFLHAIYPKVTVD